MVTETLVRQNSNRRPLVFVKRACGQDGEGQEESDKARLRGFSKEMSGRKRLAEPYSLYLVFTSVAFADAFTAETRCWRRPPISG